MILMRYAGIHGPRSRWCAVGLIAAGVLPAFGQPTPVREQVASALVAPASVAPTGLGVDDLVRLAVERNPRLARAAFAVDAARGRFVQAGMYPNPVFSYAADELADRTGRVGIHTPSLSQEIVRGGKLRLSQAVAAREVDQATLNLMAERYGIVGTVRAGFYEVFALQQRARILAEVVQLAEQAADLSRKSFEAKQTSRLDVVTLEVELERFRAEAEAVARELPAAYRRLAAQAGDSRLPVTALAGSLEAPLPEYDLETTRETVLAVHPEVRAARVAVDRAQAALRRAQVEPVPNITLNGGYVYQGQNRSNDVSVGLSMPIPVWNKNQGNIRSAQAGIGEAVQDVARIENELAERVATAFRTYSAARQRAERYRASLLPRAAETYDLSLKAFRGGQFEYLRVVQAQRALAEARLEYNRALGDAWRTAGEISGYLLEEVWPPQSTGPSPEARP